ncbi:MAG: helix-turn-helix domain-containing protein [Bacteroidota bacterium]
MDKSFIFHSLITFGALQALFLSVILLSSGKKDLPKTFFALFLIIEGITLVERLLAETGMMVRFPHILGVSYPINFIKPPILYFLARSISEAEFSFRKKQLFHTIPFLLMLVMNIPFYGLSGEEKVEQVSAFITYIPAYNSFNFWFFLSFFIYIGSYLFLGIGVLANYKKHIKNNRLVNRYLNVIYLYCGVLAIMLLHFILRPSGLVEFPFINEVSMLLMTFLIQSIAYGFLSQSALVTQSHHRFLTNVSQLSKDSELIRRKIETDKPYLDDTLNLEKFSISVDLPKKRVSEIINQSFNCSFKELVNQYRFEEAKAIMKEEAGTDAQIVSIGYRSGFNNKVSFYRIFKKYTGKSPSDYFEILSR